MSKINEIVNLVNAELESTTLISKRFQKGNILGLAELVTKEEEEPTTVPLILNNNGEGTEVMLDDNYPFQIYHRITDIAVADNNGDDFGDGDTTVEVTTMKMVVFANRRIMEFQIDDLITAINVGFPLSLSKTSMTTLGNWFSQVNFEVTSIEIDKQAVWNGEFNYSQPLPPYQQVFAVNYEVQSHIMAGCYDIC